MTMHCNIICIVSCIFTWYFYSSHVNADKSQCDRFDSNPLTLEQRIHYKVWPVASDPSLPSYKLHNSKESLYGFAHAMKVIWENQHSVNCKDAKFLLFSAGGNCGYGCDAHFESVALNWALKTGRVLLRRTKHASSAMMNYAFQFEYCNQAHEHNWRCYYEPESSCSLEDVFPGFNHSDPSTWSKSEEGVEVFNIRKSIESQTAHVLFLETNGNIRGEAHVIPKAIGPLVECANFPSRDVSGSAKKWWEAVAVAYLLRPNSRTLTLMHQLSTFDLTNEADPVIGMYVRHGDKHAEMKLLPWIQYANAAQILWDSGVVHKRVSGLPSPYRPTKNGTIFLGTEDPIVISEAIEWGQKFGWKILYTKVLNRSWLFAADRQRVGIESLSNGQGYAEGHHNLEMPSILLNVHHFLQCSAWVATMGSNMNRLLDELKITVGGKADLTTADIRYNVPPLIYKGFFNRDMELIQQVAERDITKKEN